MSNITANKVHIPIFSYAVDGAPTCSAKAAEHNCQFLSIARMGTEFGCNFLLKRLERGNDGIGYLIPDADCPLHGDSESGA